MFFPVYVDLRPLQDERVAFEVVWGEITQTIFPGESVLRIQPRSELAVTIAFTREGVKISGEQEIRAAMDLAAEDERMGLPPTMRVGELEAILQLIEDAKQGGRHES